MPQNLEDSQQPCDSDCDEEQGLLYERTATPLCRICLETDGELLKACNCAGTQGYVHRKCLRNWVTHYSNTPEHCELCKTEWKIEMYSHWEKCLQRWNWLLAMGGWYCVIMFTLFDFHYAAIDPLGYRAFLFWLFIQGMWHLAIRFTGQGMFKIFRITSTLLWYTGMITILAAQDDYEAQTRAIDEDRWMTWEERKIAHEELVKRTEVDDPFGWPMEHTHGNRQMWTIAAVDIVLWMSWFTFVKYGLIRYNRRWDYRPMRIASSSSDEYTTSSSSEES